MAVDPVIHAQVERIIDACTLPRISPSIIADEAMKDLDGRGGLALTAREREVAHDVFREAASALLKEKFGNPAKTVERLRAEADALERYMAARQDDMTSR